MSTHGDQCQSTPLHLASSRRDAEIAQLLIKHGADVHARDQSQSMPLHLASSKGDAETAQLLIKHGADVHARDQSQSTPLHRASSLPSWLGDTTVHLLIERGASVNAYDKNHQTPLHRVSSCDDPDVGSLRLLLENGADVDVEDDKGLTAFQIASAKGWRHREDRTVATRPPCPYRVEYD
jgi:ankyrin repeat protein